MEVVGEVGDGAEAVERPAGPARRGADGHPDARRGRASPRPSRSPPTPTLAGVKVIVLTTFEMDEYVLAALRAGASGFLGKGVRPAALLDGIRTVAARGVAALAEGDPRPHRQVLDPQVGPGRRRAERSPRSPRASARSSSWSRTG